MRFIISLVPPGALLMSCGHSHVISGSVMDRNGSPIERAIVSLEPGNVELITDSDGGFIIDYLRADDGERIKLDKRTDYTVSVFKPGYHDADTSFFYKRGELFLEPLTMVEDTIRVETSQDNIDPDQYPDRAQNHGAAYEGE